jgi:hypothetical protein
VAILAYYTIVDTTARLVSPSFPYTKAFPTFFREPAEQAYLEMWVKTGYSQGSQSALVRINGTEVGKIWPRPWTNHNYVDAEAVAFIFGGGLLRSGFNFPWIPPLFGEQNRLEIVPQGSAPDNYVLVGDIICYFKQRR